ncbi:MAG TPA: 6-pyruvoyl-tetrahydropterin synthase-related protein [Patescibacteria group bacterium]
MKQLVKFIDVIALIAICLLSFWAIKPLLSSEFFPMHDNTQVARTFEMGKALKDGVFPVRIVSDLGFGYGYPLFNFYAPLAYYIGGFLTFVGLTALSATKLTMIIAILFSGITMYLLAKAFFGRYPAILASILYVYATYHAVDIYVRGDLAEYMAYAFIPLAFYGLWQTYLTKKWKYILVGALGYGGLIISHNLTAFMASPVLFIAAILMSIVAFRKNPKGAFAPLLTLLFGIVLASFYWIPVFAEMKYTNVLSQIGGGADFTKNFVCIQQFWFSQWGYGGSVPGCTDGISFMIGKLHIFFAVLGFLSIFLLRKKYVQQFASLLFASIGLIICLFLSTSASTFFWKIIPGSAFLQYPWRFLELISFFAAFLGAGFLFTVGSILKKQKNNFGMYSLLFISGISILAVIFLQQKFFVPQKYIAVTSGELTNTRALFEASKISNEYMPPHFVTPTLEKEYVKNSLEITPFRGQSTIMVNKTQIKAAKIVILRLEPFVLPLAYFPGWHMYVDGKETQFVSTTRGLLVNIPVGYHTLVLQYHQTGIEVLANLLSVAGVIGLILGIILNERKLSHGKTSS